MKLLHGLAFLPLIASGAAAAQPASGGVIAPPSVQAPAAGAIDCAKAANKALPACVHDKGMVRPPPPADDPAIRRAPPPTGDAIANPRGTAAADKPALVPR